MRAGADDFLTKPFDGLEIQIRVKTIMRLNRFRNLVAERSRFYWVVENDEKGYLVLNENGTIQYANQRAQVFFFTCPKPIPTSTLPARPSATINPIGRNLIAPVAAPRIWFNQSRPQPGPSG